MRTQVHRAFRLLAVFGLCCACLAACTPAGPSGPQVWIDFPLDGSVLPPSPEVVVTSHAFVPGGVAEILLTVNGAPYRRDPPASPGSELTHAEQAWRPDAPGSYLLQVVAYDAAGTARASDAVSVHIASEGTPASTPSGFSATEADATEAAATSVAATSLAATSAAATAQFTVVPPAAPTIPLTPYISFYAERTSLEQGECTKLHWVAENEFSATLDGTVVDLHGEQTVCPTATRTYQLSVIAQTGPVTQSVTITVSAPPQADTTRPSVQGVSASTDIIRMPNCTPNTVTIEAQVSDAGGLASVKLVYRVTGGSWEERSMSTSGGRYRTTLDWGALEDSRDPVPTSGDPHLEYYIRARDSAGNTTESGVNNVSVAGCLI